LWSCFWPLEYPGAKIRALVALALAATASSVTVTPRNSVLYATISPKLHSNQ